MGAEGLDNDVAQSSIRVDGGFVRFLASFRQLVTVDVCLDLMRELLSGERLQARNAVSVETVSGCSLTSRGADWSWQNWRGIADRENRQTLHADALVPPGTASKRGWGSLRC